MSGCHPTRSLRDEHVLILRVADALERMLDTRPQQNGEGPPTEFPAFFRLYADALHHGKEEDLLFDTLEEHGFSKVTGPIAHMLEEHRLGRALVHRMDEAARSGDGAEDPAAAWRDYEAAGRAYIDLIRGHILKEDHALFDMADHTIQESACQRLCAAYEDVCGRRFEGRTTADLEELGRTLTTRYP